MVKILQAGPGTSRFIFLLAAIFLELLLTPVLMSSPTALTLGRILTGIVLLAALLVVGARPPALVLFGLAATLHAAGDLLKSADLSLVGPIARFAFLGYVFVLILMRVMRDRNVSYDTIAGAACGYVLLGLVWGELFILAQHFRPESFEIPASFTAETGGDIRPALMYFSLVTLTTVGYGFIHPNNAAAGGLAVSEAIAGQLYLAVTISRLVGLHISDRGK